MDKIFKNTIDMTTAIQAPSPKWKVYFTGNFWGHHTKDHAGIEIKIDKQFDWAGYHWVIPAVYSCGRGLVIDLCMQVNTEKIRSFLQKWQLNTEDHSYNDFTREQQMQMELENPLCLNFIPHLELNKKILHTSHSCSVCFNPCFSSKIDMSETNKIISHYELDTAFGWVIYRNAFPWTTKRRPEIKTLSLTMKQRQNQVPGPHFKVHQKGDFFTFYHPVSGQSHTLTVHELEPQTIPRKHFNSDCLLYPTHFTSMSYTISPEPVENITIFDCDDGDKPLKMMSDETSRLPMTENASCISIIGGSDDPTSIVFTSDSHVKLHTACSSLHFKPLQNDVKWHIVFNIMQFDEATFSLI